MEMSYVSDVDELISGLEATYVGDRALVAGDDVDFTNTCFTCGCVTK